MVSTLVARHLRASNPKDLSPGPVIEVHCSHQLATAMGTLINKIYRSRYEEQKTAEDRIDAGYRILSDKGKAHGVYFGFLGHSTEGANVYGWIEDGKLQGEP